jgi:hypothetical protein
MNRPEPSDNFSSSERDAFEFHHRPLGDAVVDLSDWHDHLDESADEDWRDELN